VRGQIPCGRLGNSSSLKKSSQIQGRENQGTKEKKNASFNTEVFSLRSLDPKRSKYRGGGRDLSHSLGEFSPAPFRTELGGPRAGRWFLGRDNLGSGSLRPWGNTGRKQKRGGEGERVLGGASIH